MLILYSTAGRLWDVLDVHRAHVLADEWDAQNRQALRFSKPHVAALCGRTPHVAALIDPYVTQCTSSELLPLWRFRGVDFKGVNSAP